MSSMGHCYALVIEQLHMDASDGGALAGRRMGPVGLIGRFWDPLGCPTLRTATTRP